MAAKAGWHEMALNGKVNKKIALRLRQEMALPVVAANPLMSREVRRKASDGLVDAFSNSKPRIDKMRLPRVAAAFWGSRSSAMVYSPHVPR